MSESWLVFETSGRVGKLGLARDGTIVRSRRLEETRRLARDLAPTVSELLAEEVLQPKEIAGVMVSIGPGSYTGLRVGITSAKSFAYATGCKLIAVPTFAAIALQAPDEAREVWVIADALQGMIYVQRLSGSDGIPLDELRIVNARQLLVGDRTGLDRRERQLGTLDGSPCRLEAFRPLGVVPVRAVPKKPWVGEEDGVSHELPRRSAR